MQPVFTELMAGHRRGRDGEVNWSHAHHRRVESARTRVELGREAHGMSRRHRIPRTRPAGRPAVDEPARGMLEAGRWLADSEVDRGDRRANGAVMVAPRVPVARRQGVLRTTEDVASAVIGPGGGPPWVSDLAVLRARQPVHHGGVRRGRQRSTGARASGAAFGHFWRRLNVQAVHLAAEAKLMSAKSAEQGAPSADVLGLVVGLTVSGGGGCGGRRRASRGPDAQGECRHDDHVPTANKELCLNQNSLACPGVSSGDRRA